MLLLIFIAVFAKWRGYWLQAYLSAADVSVKSMIVTAKVMGRQVGLRIGREGGMSTDRLLAHHLASGA